MRISSSSGTPVHEGTVSISAQRRFLLLPIIRQWRHLQSGRPLVKQKTSAKTKPNFNPHTFLSTAGKGRAMLSFRKKAKILVQGDSKDGLFFVQTGKVRLSVVSEN